MKKNLLSIAIIAVLVVAMVGGTMAWFTDKATLQNEFEAGTVKLEVGNEGIDGGAVDLTNWNPGDTNTIKYTFENAGSKNLRFRIGFEGVWVNQDGYELTLPTDNIELVAIGDEVLTGLDYKWWKFPFVFPEYEDSSDPITTFGWVEDLLDEWLGTDKWSFNPDDHFLYYGGELGTWVNPPNDGILVSGESDELEMKIKLNGPETDNRYQGMTFRLKAHVQAIQASHFEEEDGWTWDDEIVFETAPDLE